MASAITTPSERHGAGVASAAPSTTVITLIVAMAAVVLALYFGRAVLQPLALAILFSFALAPIIKRLQRWSVPKTPAVIAVTLLMFLILGGVTAVVSVQAVDLARKIPEYEQNLLDKINSVRDAAPEGGLLRQMTNLGRDLEKAIARASDGSTAAPGAAQKPVAVEVQAKSSPLQVIGEYAGPILAPLASAGIVIVFMIVILLQREDLRNRLIRLAGSADLQRTTTAIDDGVSRLSRYLLAQFILNSAFGTVIGLGLWAVGLPNPLLWGIIAGLMRFVPFIGSFIAASLPIMVALAVSPGWTMPLLTLAIFVVLEMAAGNVVEPWLYGSSTGLSPLSVLVAAIFWTMIWGPVGLLLATPLTVCLVVLGRHVPQLHFLEVILGDRPALSPETRLYQRMLAGDAVEAIGICEEEAEGRPLHHVYENVVIPALRLAEEDRRAGGMPRETRGTIAEVTGEIVEALSDEPEAPSPPKGEAPQPDSVVSLLRRKGSVLCLPAFSEIDAAAAIVLADLLRREGLTAEARPLVRRMESLPKEEVCEVCLVGMTLSRAQSLRLVRRVRGHFGSGTRVVVAILSTGTGALAAPDGETFITVATLAETVEAVKADALLPAAPPPTEAGASGTAVDERNPTPLTDPSSHVAADRMVRGRDDRRQGTFERR
ncbi:AI-2E family transporter [Azospirillum sp. TSO22-1]|uniref:AI-2E family transporter n=1 Tax=Azospirillum sp. TSO22-1 TaxID=716789 RepID=UPI0011B84A7C|nr:AI-2E family transporter [Azospirillum sp. TSO22-1]